MTDIEKNIILSLLQSSSSNFLESRPSILRSFEKIDLATSDDKILKTYEANEVRGNLQFRGKKILLTCHITKIGITYSREHLPYAGPIYGKGSVFPGSIGLPQHPFLSCGNLKNDALIILFFKDQKSDEEKIAELEKGQTVLLVGESTGWIDGHFVMRNARFAKDIAAQYEEAATHAVEDIGSNTRFIPKGLQDLAIVAVAASMAIPEDQKVACRSSVTACREALKVGWRSIKEVYELPEYQQRLKALGLIE